MQKHFVFISALILLALSAFADDTPPLFDADVLTQDPIGDAFVEIFDSTDPKSMHYWPPLLFVVPIDINQDGTLDLLVSANYYRNGRQGQMWQAFLQTTDGFASLEAIFRKRTGPAKGLGFVQFFYNSTRVRANPEGRSTSFFGMGTGGGGEATLEETRLTESGMEFRIAALLNAQDPEDRARIQSLDGLFQPLEPRVRLMNFGPLQVRYANRLSLEPLEAERGIGGSKVSIDARGPLNEEKFFETPEEVYAYLNDPHAPTIDTQPAEIFETAEAALKYYIARNAPNWDAAPAAKLLTQFDEEALISSLEPWLKHSERQERFSAFITLRDITCLSSTPVIRQRFIEDFLTGRWSDLDFTSDRDWLAPFARSDFNEASRVFLVEQLHESMTSNKIYGPAAQVIRWAGVAGIEEAIPLLREFNIAQRDIDYRSRSPLFMRTALIALARMGDPEAIQEMIACIEAVEKPEDRALSLQRLAVVRSPEVVEYLKRYLISDVVFDQYAAGWIPVSEAQCAADTLAEILEGFPEGGLAEQRTWLEKQSEFVFRPPGNERPFPGIR